MLCVNREKLNFSVIAVIVALFNPLGLRDKITGKSASATTTDNE
jgi:hypothetical protein